MTLDQGLLSILTAWTIETRLADMLGSVLFAINGKQSFGGMSFKPMPRLGKDVSTKAEGWREMIEKRVGPTIKSFIEPKEKQNGTSR